MMAQVVTVHSDAPDPAIVADAAARLLRGELVAFPTETVYGLGANALDPEAIARIYAAKGRPAWNPVIAHVADLDAARGLSRAWPASAERLAAAFWPGPLTVVVPKSPSIPDIATAGLDAVAVRVPAHGVALALLRAAGIPVAAPSANRFTQVSPTTAEHVVQSLGDRVPLVLDGGPCSVGIESTVVDCTGEAVVILRPGMIDRASLERALAGSGIETREAAATIAHDSVPATSARSPGMADRHYAPRAEVWLFTPDQREEIDAALQARYATTAVGVPLGPVVALLRTVRLATPLGVVIPMPLEAADYARALYASLHEADARAASLVLIEAPPADAEGWAGVHDRLTRAAR